MSESIETTDSHAQETVWKRRGLFAAAAALVAAIFGKLAEERVEAGTDGEVVLGMTQTTSGSTQTICIIDKRHRFRRRMQRRDRRLGSPRLGQPVWSLWLDGERDGERCRRAIRHLRPTRRSLYCVFGEVGRPASRAALRTIDLHFHDLRHEGDSRFGGSTRDLIGHPTVHHGNGDAPKQVTVN